VKPIGFEPNQVTHRRDSRTPGFSLAIAPESSMFVHTDPNSIQLHLICIPLASDAHENHICKEQSASRQSNRGQRIMVSP
jgi:hypothetical protein